MSEAIKAPRQSQEVRVIPSAEWSKEACAAQKRALEHPENADAWMELGLELRKQMLFREAIKAYSEGLSRQPFHSLLYRHRGHALVNIGCYASTRITGLPGIIWDFLTILWVSMSVRVRLMHSA